MVNTINYVFSSLALLAQVAIVFLLWIKLARKESALAKFISQRVLALSFLTALGGVAGSLFYSEIAGYSPCSLCWYQRVFLFPQVFILGLALAKKDFSVIPYVKTLAVVGGLIAGYQSALQMDLVPSLFCSAATVNCAQRFVMNFGYITLPVMSLTAFLLLIALTSFNIKKKL